MTARRGARAGTAEPDPARTSGEIERLGSLAHELRNHLHSAMLAFETLRRSPWYVDGIPGAVLGRSLLALRGTVASTLADIRMAALPEHREALGMPVFLGDLAVAAALQAEHRGLTFTLAGVDADLVVRADPHLLGSAVTNLLDNAFKFTRAGGAVHLGATQYRGKIHISVQDQCGGIPESARDPFEAFGDRRGLDRSGLGLGLSIARKAARAHGGDITIRNMPGAGCVFTIELPSDAP